LHQNGSAVNSAGAGAVNSGANGVTSGAKDVTSGANGAQSAQAKMDLGERKALWESLVRLVEEGEAGENGEDAHVLERLGCGSRLSNISAIMEMFGEQGSQGSPARQCQSSAVSRESRVSRTSRTKSITLRKFLTPGWRNRGAATPPASTPTDSFQVHPPPQEDLPFQSPQRRTPATRLLDSIIYRHSARVSPLVNGSGPPLPQNTVIGPDQVADLHHISSVNGGHFLLESWAETGTRYTRTLSETENAIHVLDGPDTRYFFGIIDIFTTYGWRQRLVRMLKSFRHCGGDHSSRGPDSYAARFVHFIEAHVA